MHPNERDWDLFYSRMLKRTGIDLHQYKAPQMQRRILNMAQFQKCATLEEFWAWTSATPEHVQQFLDKLAINVSELFRNPEKWAQLENELIPRLLKRSRQLRVWSAGCSYGAEAHTLAMIFAEKYGPGHKIIGTDIDEAALSQARAGEFSLSDTKYVPQAYKKYLTADGDVFRADARLRAYLDFRRHNLLGDRFDQGFDLIMCRNVVIYFTDEAKEELYKKFYASLKPGGIMFVGSTERVSGAEDIGFSTALPFFYQKPEQDKPAWRSAS